MSATYTTRLNLKKPANNALNWGFDLNDNFDILDGAFAALFNINEKIDIDLLPLGDTEDTVCVGNDPRLSDARFPTAHTQDASTITSGVFDIARIPPSALERLVVVATEIDRFDLTTEIVQKGDTVLQTNTKEMFFVIDTENLDSESGYQVYKAGLATSVPWSGISDKPASEFGDTEGTFCEGNDPRLKVSENKFGAL